MVLINGTKYACETCIKGHRSSTCRHTDRPLFEIKKKGRPVTQCEHCRELRKTKQVHVKCICESKGEHAIYPTTHQKGHHNIPDSATYPNGLPEALGTLVATQTSEGASSDTDHSGMMSDCSCKADGPCLCCTPRKSAPRIRKRDVRQVDAIGHEPSVIAKVSSSTGVHASRTPSHILARLAELRPVLPRPIIGPLHDPSCGQTVRHYNHLNASFSPYGRAYDHAHHDPLPNQAFLHHSQSSSAHPIASMTHDEKSFRDQLHALEAVTASSWTPSSFPSMCGCGDSCNCPGCAQHNSGDTDIPSTAFSLCTNPGICNNCLDRTLLSLPASLPPDTSLSIFDAHQTASIDDWIRQVSSLPRASPTGVPASSLACQEPWGGYMVHSPERNRNPERAYPAQECRGVLCKCSPHPCDCEIEKEYGYNSRQEWQNPAFADSDIARSGNSYVSQSPVGIGYPGNESSPHLPLSTMSRSRSSSGSSRSSLGHRPQCHISANKTSSDHSAPSNCVGKLFPPIASMSSPDLRRGLPPIISTDFNRLSEGLHSMASISPTHGEISLTYARSNPELYGYFSGEDIYCSYQNNPYSGM